MEKKPVQKVADMASMHKENKSRVHIKPLSTARAHEKVKKTLSLKSWLGQQGKLEISMLQKKLLFAFPRDFMRLLSHLLSVAALS